MIVFQARIRTTCENGWQARTSLPCLAGLMNSVTRMAFVAEIADLNYQQVCFIG